MKKQSEETPPKVFGTGETPSFDEAWNKAEHYTKLLWTDYGKEYLERAKKSKAFPYIIPRAREQYTAHDKFLKGAKLVLKSGRSERNVWAKEVDKAYAKLNLDLTRAKIDQLKFECHMEDEKPSKETLEKASIHDQLPVRNSNYPVFKPLLLDAFMNLYDQHPQLKKHLREIVKDHHALNHQFNGTPQQDAVYLKVIKKAFNDNTKSLAKENSKLMGEN
jgi:hypothetical protein